MEKIVIGNKFNQKYSFRETCFGIYEKNGQILLVKKDNQYSLVGGGIEGEESRSDCLRREFLEESGYKLTSVKELLTIDCFWLAGGKYPMESLVNVYIVEVDDTLAGEPLEKNCQIEFVDINDVERLLPLPYHKKAIEYYKEKCK
jgi:8-oxo-dGTP diphosphatase